MENLQRQHALLKRFLANAVGVVDSHNEKPVTYTFHFIDAEECEQALKLLNEIYPQLEPVTFANYIDDIIDDGETELPSNCIRFDCTQNVHMVDAMWDKLESSFSKFFIVDNQAVKKEAIPEKFGPFDDNGEIIEPELQSLYAEWLEGEEGQQTLPATYKYGQVARHILEAKLKLKQERHVENFVLPAFAAPTNEEDPLELVSPGLKALHDKLLELALDLKFVIPPGIAYIYVFLKDEKVAEFLESKKIDAGILAASAYDSLKKLIQHDDGTYTYKAKKLMQEFLPHPPMTA